MTYLIHCVDKGLSISPRETANHISHVPAREDCLDEGYEFTFGDGAADQSLQGLFTRVENGRWLSGERGRCGIFGKNDVLIRNGFGIGGLDSLNRLSSLHHVSVSPRVHQ